MHMILYKTTLMGILIFHRSYYRKKDRLHDKRIDARLTPLESWIACLDVLLAHTSLPSLGKV